MLVHVMTLQFNSVMRGFDDAPMREFIKDDDVLIFGDEKRMLQETLSCIRDFLGRQLLLELKETATILAAVGQGVPFLGFRLSPGVVRLGGRRGRGFAVR